MDREAREEYLVVVQVKDMLGLSGGYSSSTTVTVSLTDVNDNGPTFQHRESLIWFTMMQIPGHTRSVKSMKEYKALQAARTCLILYLRGIYLITLRFRWVVCAASTAFGCAHLVIQPAAKIKRRQSKNERGGREKETGKEMGMFGSSVCARVHVYMRCPLDEFNHSHTRAHLSWPLETNLAFSAINLTKWMPWEEINSVEMRQQGWYF